MSIGFTVPFLRATGSLGYLEMTESEISAVRENIRSLLITNWGERVMRPTMGCNLREFLFENFDEKLKEKIADRIITQISMWMPFVVIRELSIVFPDEDQSLVSNTIKISINFYLSSRPQLSGEITHVVQ